MNIAVEEFEKQADVRILKRTPMQKALERNGRFAPMCASPVSSMPGIEIPTVWVKVK